MTNRFLIIAGTEKAGTTSLFQYLADSGLFWVSKKKETDYFRGSCGLSAAGYLEEFDRSIESAQLFLEASPGYLSDSQVAAQNIEELGLGTDVILIFMLRSPLQRLKSSFLFHKSRLYLRKDMGIDEYLELCFRYQEGHSPESVGLGEWYLRVLETGRYRDKLEPFLGHRFPIVKVFAFDDFRTDPKACVVDILRAVGVSTEFYDDYAFGSFNVTSNFRNPWVQGFALRVNSRFEHFFQRHPLLKKRLLSIYGFLNGAEKETVEISARNLERLKDFYFDDIQKLRKGGIISEKVASKWIKEFD